MRKFILTIAALAALSMPALAQSKSEADTALGSFSAGMDATVVSINKMRNTVCPKQVGQYAQTRCKARFETPINAAVLAKAEVAAAYLAAVMKDKAGLDKHNQMVKQNLDDIQVQITELARDYK
jgi:hypothetical protein